ncbi:MAG: class I SAM-dependent methyltransferase [Treponema sp.]|nr:class I SAM-dependent methyltransferase [Treponema sp.]
MIQKNRWKEIWNNRVDNLNIIDINDSKQVFLELKRLDGFDITNEGIPYESLIKQYQDTKNSLYLEKGDSVFEVGCGSGANLLLFHKDGILIGGLDYSKNLIEIMKKIFKGVKLRECICSEAADCPTNIQYDAILSNSVFSYFLNYDYAEVVLSRMIKKCQYFSGFQGYTTKFSSSCFRESRLK